MIAVVEVKYDRVNVYDNATRITKNGANLLVWYMGDGKEEEHIIPLKYVDTFTVMNSDGATVYSGFGHFKGGGNDDTAGEDKP